MEPRIYALLAKVNAETDKVKKAELQAETNVELGRHFARNLQDLEEFAFALFQVAWRDVVGGYWSQPGVEDIVSALIEVKTVGKFDTDFIEEDLRGLRAYFQGKGGQIRADIIRYERQQMPREELVTALEWHIDDLESDFWGNVGSLQAQAKEKFRTAPAEKLIDLIRTAVTAGSTYATVAASSVADTNVDPVLDAVAQRSGGQATLFGTLAAIRKLANVGLDFGPLMQERIFQTGVIGNYKGYPVAQLGNWENFEGAFALPDNELYVIGKNAGRMTWFGGTPKTQTLQLPAFRRRFETAQDVGMSLYGAGKGRVGRIVLT